MKMKSFVLTVALAIGLFVVSGGCSNSTLETGGAYTTSSTNSAGEVTTTSDMVLFKADSAFELCYTSLQTVFQLERNNRELLWKTSPEIKHTLDKCRAQVLPILQRWALARKAYVASSTTANMTTLEGILTDLQTILVAAQAGLTTGTNTVTTATSTNN